MSLTSHGRSSRERRARSARHGAASSYVDRAPRERRHDLVEVAVGVRGPGEVLPHALGAGARVVRPRLAVGEQPPQRRLHLGGVAGVDEEARVGGADDVLRSAVVGRHDGQARRGRLDQRDAEVLHQGRVDEHAAAGGGQAVEDGDVDVGLVPLRQAPCLPYRS
jgi:hypothetical protein